ncbi:hypothetical protein HN51_044235 [Arachis hypogaea]
MKQVTDPDNSSQSIYEAWTSSGISPLIGRLGGGGSDYKPFVQHVGILSIDIAFGGEFLVPKREASVRISLCQNFLYIKNVVVSSNLTP